MGGLLIYCLLPPDQPSTYSLTPLPSPLPTLTPLPNPTPSPHTLTLHPHPTPSPHTLTPLPHPTPSTHTLNPHPTSPHPTPSTHTLNPHPQPTPSPQSLTFDANGWENRVIDSFWSVPTCLSMRTRSRDLDAFSHSGMNVCPICGASLSHHTLCMGILVWFQ